MPRLQRQNAKYDETIAPCDDDDNVKKDNIKNIENDTGSVDEVISRIKKFNDFSHRTERGSSKTLCSFVPVIFIFVFLFVFLLCFSILYFSCFCFLLFIAESRSSPMYLFIYTIYQISYCKCCFFCYYFSFQNVEADYLPRSRLEADNEGENE